jgi:hypothetical protein
MLYHSVVFRNIGVITAAACHRKLRRNQYPPPLNDRATEDFSFSLSVSEL